jgi:hypothetical protein
VPIWAGNTRPVVAIEWPPCGGVAGLGESVEFRVCVIDPEDGEVEQERVSVQPFLGHDTHAHPLHPRQGTGGTFQTMVDAGHAPEADLFTVLRASYTDKGAAGIEALTGQAELVLQPRRKQAEHAAARSGARIEKGDDPDGGGQMVVFDSAGGWVSFRPVNLHGIHGVTLRAAAGTEGGAMELRLDSPDGAIVGNATLAPGQSWLDFGLDVIDPGGTHELYVVCRPGGEEALKLNWIEFLGPGVTGQSDHAAP